MVACKPEAIVLVLDLGKATLPVSKAQADAVESQPFYSQPPPGCLAESLLGLPRWIFEIM